MHPTFRRILLAALLLSLAASGCAAPALQCKVTHSLDCEADRCQRSEAEHTYIDLLIDPATGEGNLCTATYCRAISWLRTAEPDGKRQTFGPILSSASGSTEELINIPVVDFHLWIGGERRDFGLLPVNGGGASWLGTCEARREEK